VSRIRVLPEILANKIAAGEVVERPASVVKELVENALDAKGTRIRVEVTQGGRSLIRVTDNGTGMSRDDALLCIERYATSKILTDADLFAIRSLGFRGEALPSIASVSRFTLETRSAADPVGTRIEIEGGTLRKVGDAGIPAGTLVSVAGLFFNTPARRKFLKTIATEMGHIADVLTTLALGWAHVDFYLEHNDRPVRRWSAAVDPGDRVADVLGPDIRPHLVPLSLDLDFLTLRGWMARPLLFRSTTRGIHLFINGRSVRDQTVQHAIVDGFSGRLMKGQFPVAVLFLTVPPEDVDVNVHPTKSAVRLARGRDIHEALARAVGEALRIADQPRWAAAAPLDRSPQADSFPGYDPPEPGLSVFPEPPDHVAEADASDYTGSGHHAPQPSAPRSFKAPPVAAQSQTGIWEKRFFRDLRIIGQLKGTYILCESETGLVIIDQHAAHERIYYEQLGRTAAIRSGGSQMQLIPETVTLGHREAEILETMRDGLLEIGLDIEPFGGTTFAVKSVPALLADAPVGPILREAAEKALETGGREKPENLMDAVRRIMACHGALRAGQILTETHMRAMLVQLDECENPSHCPHGRPIWIHWPMRQLEKAVRRIS